VRDLRKYWQEIRAMERTLPDYVWVVGSGPHARATGTSGQAEVPAALAAKMLHSGSHRRATEEEIKAHKAAQDSLRKQAFHEDMRRQGIAVVAVEPAKKKK
jgi:hypothetical protein